MTEDKDLERLFEELRRYDETSSPPLAAVLSLDRRLPAVTRRPFVILRLAALLVLLGAAAMIAVRMRRGGPEERIPEPEATVAAWRSPTDSLLATPGRELLSEVPALVDAAATETLSRQIHETRTRTTPRKGDRS